MADAHGQPLERIRYALAVDDLPRLGAQTESLVSHWRRLSGKRPAYWFYHVGAPSPSQFYAFAEAERRKAAAG